MDNAQRDTLLKCIAETEYLLRNLFADMTASTEFERRWRRHGTIEHESIRVPELNRCATNCAEFLENVVVRRHSLGPELTLQKVREIQESSRRCTQPEQIALKQKEDGGHSQEHDIPRLILDYAPRSPNGLTNAVSLIVATDATSKAVHGLTVKLEEFVEIPDGRSKLESPVEIELEGTSDLNAGDQRRVPVLWYGERQMIKVAGHYAWHGPGQGNVPIRYRFTFLVTGQDGVPARATFVAGYDKNGMPLLERL